ncbi:glutathione-disulfide reductase [Xanthomonadaceae bacterium XH05]|nr:glutathione-disulfide reductase [Xanthomonadaceae bacterium XH05]
MKHYDYIVIGGGSGGIASVNRAAMAGKRCALIEMGEIGGTCVNAGCVPKKVMWHAAQIAEAVHRYGPDYGFDTTLERFDWGTLVANRSAYIQRIQGSYESRLEKNGIDVIRGAARFVDARTVEVDGERLTAGHILIATGSRASRPAIPGAEVGLDSDGFFALKALPQRVAIVGAGYVAVELAGVFNALGADTHLFLREDTVLRHFDPMLGSALLECMQADGVTLHTHANASALSDEGAEGLTLHLKSGERHGTDCVVWAVGRVPNTDGLELERAGIALEDSGHVRVDRFQNTSVPGVYAVGDVTRQPALTPVAVAAGRRLVDRLFGGKEDAHLDVDQVPSVVFSHPPIGTVGLSEPEARKAHGDGAVKVHHARFTPMYSAVTRFRQPAQMKLVCVGPEERIVGLHGIGHGMDEILQGFAVALRMGATKRDFDDTLAIHPTAAEEFVTMR